MQPEFWHNAWEAGKTGWKQERTNTRLQRYWPQLKAPEGASVLVPLCGDSPDLLWLATQNLRVVGVELSEIAVETFFAKNHLVFHVEQRDGFKKYQAGQISIFCGDFLELRRDIVGVPLQAAYDRAALVALTPQMRAPYVQQLRKLLEPEAAALLVTLSYDQRKMQGPPFSVDDDRVFELYSNGFTVQRLAGSNGPEILGNLADRGLDTLHESIFALTRHAGGKK